MNTQKSLYILACFISGAAMMIIEVSGIRLLAPVFGNSLATWTALIGVVLVGFSIGGFYGGYLADKTTKPTVIVTTLIASAVFVIIVPSLHAITAKNTSSLSFLYGPTVLSAILFLIPGSLLGIINPYATRLLAKLSDDKKIGAATGAANVASALGSFIGTFVAGFYLVPLLDVRIIFLLTALTLVLLGVAILIASELELSKRRVMAYTSSILFALVLASGIKITYATSVIEVSNSKYQQIMIYESEYGGQPIRTMVNNGQAQGAIDTDTNQSIYAFQHYWKIINQYVDSIDHALMVGGGTYSVPQGLKDTYPDANITVVEIDEEVTTAAIKYFNLGDYPTFNIVNSDARWFSNNDTTLYDFIFLDAYNGNTAIPSHLTTVEYFNTLKNRLAPGGLIMMNVIGTESGNLSTVFGALYNTFGSVFHEVDVFKAPLIHEAQRVTNLLVLGSKNGELPSLKYPVSSEIQGYINTRIPREDIHVSSSPTLTDNRNPLDIISSRLQLEL